MMAQGVYRIPKIGFDGAVALTNTTPMGAFRGAGRPEAAACSSASWTSPPPSSASTRSRSGGATSSTPTSSRYTTLMGATYDSGDYDLPLREALRIGRLRRAAGRAGAPAGSAATASCSASASAPTSRSPRAAGGSEYGAVEVHDDGTATITAGTSAHGQGHATAFAMIVADRLGIPLERSASCSPTPPSCRAAAAPAGRARCSSAAAPCHGAADAVLEQATTPRGRAARGRRRRHRGDRRRPVGVAGVPRRA